MGDKSDSFSASARDQGRADDSSLECPLDHDTAVTDQLRARLLGYAARLMNRYLDRIGFGDTTPEDLVQIAHLKLLNAEREGIQVFNVEAWMKTAIRRAWIDRMRKPLSRTAVGSNVLDGRKSGEPNAEDALLAEATRRAACAQAYLLIDAADLTTAEYDVVRAIYLSGILEEGRATARAAALLHTTPGAIRTHHSRALSKLRRAALARSLRGSAMP